VRALDEVSLKVGRGEIFGFFGPYGAGKSTVIRVLCGFARVNKGDVKVLGIDVKKHPVQARDNMAIVSEETRFYEEMTTRKYLNFFGKLMLMKKARRLEALNKAADLAGVNEFLDTRIGKLSPWQQQRVSLARVLMSDAPLMLLDEPFEWIDVVHRRKLREHLRDYVKGGNSVFFASRDLTDAALLVDKFAFVSHGRVIASGTVDDLKEKYLASAYTLQVSDPQMAKELLEKELHLVNIKIVEGNVSITLQNRSDAAKIPEILTEAGLGIYEMKAAGTIEEIIERIARGEVS
jgi:ABC-type multidrug transport system ATPase subunit